VGTGQNAVAHRDRTHGARVTAIDARFAVEDLAAHDLGFKFEHGIADQIGIRCVIHAFGQRGDGLGRDLARLLGTGLLAGNAIGLAQFGFGELGYTGDQCFVLGWRLPIPLRLAGSFNQFVDRLDGDLHLVMTENHGTQHDFFG
jgi:hypothetical protein